MAIHDKPTMLVLTEVKVTQKDLYGRCQQSERHVFIISKDQKWMKE